MTGEPRVVVTGMGAVSPFGVGVEPLVRALQAGESAIGAFDVFDARAHRTHVAAQVPGSLSSASEDDAGGGAQRERTSGARRDDARATRTDRFALAAGEQAWRAARLERADRARVGVYFGSSTGGMLEGERFFAELLRRGPRAARASRIAAQPTSAPAQALARRLEIRGPVETVASACSASTMAIEAALLALRAGEVDVALAGGADALCQLTYGGFNALRAVDERAARPFRADRAGLSLGEGAAVLVLEREEHALARGASALAELAGAASTCDAYHMTAPDPEARGAARAIRAALEDARIAPDEIDFVDAHGTGTPLNDVAEACALRAVLGERAARVPIAATKGAIGHLLGACGALEAVVTLACLCAGRVHPAPGGGEADPALGVDLVLVAPRDVPRARAALTVNFAFGGANAALVFRALARAESA